MIISMTKVSKDTVCEELELEELGKGLVIPADAFNLKESMRGPATGQFDAMAIEISSPRGEGQMGISRVLAQSTKID